MTGDQRHKNDTTNGQRVSRHSGRPFAKPKELELFPPHGRQPTVVKEESNVKIITPIMGFNNKIGILVIELKHH